MKKIVMGKDYLIKFSPSDINRCSPDEILFDDSTKKKFVLYFDSSKVVPIHATEVKYFSRDHVYVLNYQNEEYIFVDYGIKPSSVNGFKQIQREIKKYEANIEVLTQNKKDLDFRLNRLSERLDSYHENHQL
jgi:hypothetical protein